MIKSTAVAGLMLCLASVARAQDPICIIDGTRHPVADCTGGRVLIPGGEASLAEALRKKQWSESIESVEVLKGAAAAAEYGPDAAFGVIVIKTKTGAATPALAAQAPDDPLARYLFPPELVMAHQQAIGLTDPQRLTIQTAIKDAQLKLVDLQFKMSQEVEKLQKLIQGVSVDQAKVLEQADHLLTLEREVKHAQLTLMIKIKNTLTEQQQTALAKLRG
jgi:TonB-dependent SusC/RagA subfamily outer membrane receptor